MPRIPQYSTSVPVRSVAPITGLQPARIENPIPGAIGQLGQVIGNIGEMIYKRELQHQEEDKKVFLLSDATDTEKGLLTIDTKIAEAKTPDDIINIYQDDFKNFKKQKLEGNSLALENISKDTALGKRIHQIGGFTEDEIATYKLKLSNAFDHYDAKLSKIVAEARDTRGVQIAQDATNTVILGWIDGIYTHKEVKEIITEAYFDSNVKNASIHIANEIQKATITYLNDAFDKEKTDVIDAFNKGVFNKDLMGSAGDKGELNHFRDLETSLVRVRKSDERQVEADRKGALIESGLAEVETKESGFVEKFINHKLTEKDLLMSKPINFSQLPSQVQNRWNSTIEKFTGLLEARRREPDTRINPYDNKNTDMTFFTKKLGQAINGEIKPDDPSIQPQPFKLGIGHSKIIKEAIEGKFEDVQGFLKREIKNGRARILKGIAGQIGMFDPLSVKNANNFESAMMERVSKAKNKDEMNEMLTPESSKYIGDELVERFTPTIQEMKEYAIKSQKSMKGNIRQEGETIQQFDERKKKNKPESKTVDDVISKNKAIDTINTWNAKPENKNKKIIMNDENIRKTIEYQQRKGR